MESLVYVSFILFIVMLLYRLGRSNTKVIKNHTLTLNVPHPEKCLDTTMISFIAETPNYKLESVFKEYFRLKYIIKPFYLQAYLEKINNGEININDYNLRCEDYKPNENLETGKQKGSKISHEDILRFKSNKIDSEFLKPLRGLKDKTHVFYGKKVVITGTFNNFPYRNEMAYLLWSVGADVDVAMSPRIEIVIVGANPGWKKLDEIDKYQPQVIDEELFLEYFPSYTPKFINLP